MVIDNGEVYYCYGGDFGDDLSNKDFCIDGMLMFDCMLFFSLYEYKKVIEFIIISVIDVLLGEFLLLSWFDFENLVIFNLVYIIIED